MGKIKQTYLDDHHKNLSEEERQRLNNTPKSTYAILSQTPIPDKVVEYLLNLRFCPENLHEQFEQTGPCWCCRKPMDRDHIIKCDISRSFRTWRHDGIVKTLISEINNDRHPQPITTEDGLKPDIHYICGVTPHCIDVAFAVNNQLQTRYNRKGKKYSTPYKNNMIPFIVRYDGIIYHKSMRIFKALPEIRIEKVYESIYH